MSIDFLQHYAYDNVKTLKNINDKRFLKKLTRINFFYKLFKKKSFTKTF